MERIQLVALYPKMVLLFLSLLLLLRPHTHTAFVDSLSLATTIDVFLTGEPDRIKNFKNTTKQKKNT